MSEKALTPQLARELADVNAKAGLSIAAAAYRAHAAEQEEGTSTINADGSVTLHSRFGDVTVGKPAPERGESREALPTREDWGRILYISATNTESGPKMLAAARRLASGSLALVPSEELERLRSPSRSGCWHTGICADARAWKERADKAEAETCPSLVLHECCKPTALLADLAQAMEWQRMAENKATRLGLLNIKLREAAAEARGLLRESLSWSCVDYHTKAKAFLAKTAALVQP